MIPYKATAGRGTGEITEKKSRFIAHTASVETAEEAQMFIEDIKKEYWDARHNCYAYSIGIENPVTRYSDDGEPGGTAGRPILEVIQGCDVHNVVIVVTRYFGGTLLGTGGLVRAYSAAAKEGLKDAGIVHKIPAERVLLTMNYTDFGKVQYLLAEHDVEIEDTQYTDQVLVTAAVPEERKESIYKLITDQTGGRVPIEKHGSLYIEQLAD